MRIETLVLREIRMRLKAPFETSFGVAHDRRILLVEAIVDGISGWGEVTAVESPSYNAETTETAWHIISDFIAPRLIGAEVQRATEVATLLASIRGHQMAKAGVENAIWDAQRARIDATGKQRPGQSGPGRDHRQIARNHKMRRSYGADAK